MSSGDTALKEEFLRQYRLTWLYCPDQVIHRANAFLDSVGANGSKMRRREPSVNSSWRCKEICSVGVERASQTLPADTFALRTRLLTLFPAKATMIAGKQPVIPSHVKRFAQRLTITEREGDETILQQHRVGRLAGVSRWPSGVAHQTEVTVGEFRDPILVNDGCVVECHRYNFCRNRVALARITGWSRATQGQGRSLQSRRQYRAASGHLVGYEHRRP